MSESAPSVYAESTTRTAHILPDIAHILHTYCTHIANSRRQGVDASASWSSVPAAQAKVLQEPAWPGGTYSPAAPQRTQGVEGSLSASSAKRIKIKFIMRVYCTLSASIKEVGRLTNRLIGEMS